ncbi:SAM-dependent methyltransferase [Methylopila henanensis]|uniref:SAM-dependent methyltransferase n=1 Tax=Methylopila henanensis TaxID=873516 RepID=A0ABW4KCV1_9HYPH
MTKLRTALLAGALSALTFGGAFAQTAAEAPAAATEYTPSSGQEGKDVVWVPTAQALVDRMLEMAKVTKDDYLVDLGSGDGRTVITAAKRGVRAHGVEFNPDMVALSRKAAKAEGVAETATFEQGDIFETDFSKASVVTLFLLTELNIRLRPTILEMRPGTRVVSNSFDMGDWQPDETAQAASGCSSFCRALKWVVPAKVEGEWRLDGGALRLSQKYQMLTGALVKDGKSTPITEAKMNGAEITFTAEGKRYTGRVDGAAMSGTVEGGGAWSATQNQT